MPLLFQKNDYMDNRKHGDSDLSKAQDVEAEQN